MSDLELDEFDLGPTPSVHEILQTWFGTTDITEQTHQDCVCQIVRKAMELERELAECREANKDLSQIAAKFKGELEEEKKERTYWERSSFRAHQVCDEALREMIAAGEKVAAERDQWREVAEHLKGFASFVDLEYHEREELRYRLEQFRKLKEASK